VNSRDTDNIGCHCIACLSVIDGFSLPICSLQTLLFFQTVNYPQKAIYRATRTPQRCAVPVPTMLRIIPNAEVDTKLTAYDAFME
jgi:hypothetical protein